MPKLEDCLVTKEAVPELEVKNFFPCTHTFYLCLFLSAHLPHVLFFFIPLSLFSYFPFSPYFESLHLPPITLPPCTLWCSQNETGMGDARRVPAPSLAEQKPIRAPPQWMSATSLATSFPTWASLW